VEVMEAMTREGVTTTKTRIAERGLASSCSFYFWPSL